MGSLRSTVEAQAERGRTRGCDNGTAKGPPWGMARTYSIGFSAM
jgi:hypothetical protein